MTSLFPRGSEWREWDLHIHSPASHQWSGQKLSGDADADAALIDQMIAAMNAAPAAVFALQDYWNFDGWFALKSRLAQDSAPALKKTVFPGIELRLAAPLEGRLNAHVIFSDQINDQYLRDFLFGLKLELIEQPLSRNALIEYARKCGPDKLQKHGYKKAEVTANDDVALKAGLDVAEINVDSYKKAIQKVPDELAVGFMPFTTNDGLAQIKWDEHYAYALGLFQSSPIFETRNYDSWAAFVNLETSGNKEWIANFQAALNHIPRLAVSGSDAHTFLGTSGDNNHRGYGQFPIGKKTWIKADPTWKGLLQAIIEPKNRSYLGEMPPKMDRVRQNRTFFIDAINISKVEGSTLDDPWLDGCHITLNSDLVAIIGNKGSGKSALADIIALLGQSQQSEHFSFLRRDRFRGKSGEPARQFQGTLNWLAGEPLSSLLSDDPSSEKVELVRYIPQGRFENLCNDHVAGRSNAFERELRQVIFSHVPSEVSLGALDFDQLIEQQEEGFRESLNELRKSLHTANEQIVSIEDQLHPDVAATLKQQIALKAKQLEELKAAPPEPVAAPAEQLTEDQQKAGERLAAIEGELKAHEEGLQANKLRREALARQQRAIKNTRDRLKILSNQFQEFKSATTTDLTTLGLTFEDVAALEIKKDKLDAKAAAVTKEDVDSATAAAGVEAKKKAVLEEKEELIRKLNEPQQRYQKYLANKNVWQNAINEIEGNPSLPESKQGLEARLSQIEALPVTLGQRQKDRVALTRQIFEVLSSQRNARAELFSPIQQLIQNNTLIREEYKLQFQANLLALPENVAATLFGLVKQQSGEIRGEEESIAAVRVRLEKYQFKSADDAVGFASDLNTLLTEASQKASPQVIGIKAIMRKDKNPVDVYNLIFGLAYLEPKYTLLFQDTEIQQLSPGQRGALLLIFYLLVDKGRNPIVLDQPEENLDNETVVSLLVPVLNEAKRYRQIVMVTHNPNLAVVCDAEQIIHAAFDRKTGSKISYHSGSIEDGTINRVVVDVLEGTKIAFDNRGGKYHKQPATT
jgi:ABC-type lipoprotein export system ATPase subunit